MSDPREPATTRASTLRALTPDGVPRADPRSPPPADTRRVLARVLAVGAVIVALALAAWARACAQADRCAEGGGRWDEEWKVCRQ